LAFGIIYKILYGLFKNYEVVHAFKPLPTSFIPAYIISKIHRSKLFLDFDDWEKEGGLGFRMPFLSEFIDISIKKSDRVTVVTNFLNNETLKLNKKVVFIPNGANVDFFKPSKSKNKNIVIFVGILFKTCDVDMVIRAMKYVKNGKLIVVGDGPRRKEFEDLAQNIGVSDKVEFVGWIDRGKIPEYINSADIAVMPMKVNLINKSRSPVKFGEYMASGKAIVASNVGIANDLIVNKENGLLVSDTKQFGNAINLLLKDKNLRHKLEKNARKTAEKALDWKIIAGNLINAYETVK
jgi:glycosyltransferase involved in cell wall biosynthesis